jgi:hypothetical protein
VFQPWISDRAAVGGAVDLYDMDAKQVANYVDVLDAAVPLGIEVGDFFATMATRRGSGRTNRPKSSTPLPCGWASSARSTP